MVDPLACTTGMQEPIDTNAAAWHMMSEEQGPQLAFGQYYVHEQVLEMDQRGYGAYLGYSESDEQKLMD